MPVQAGNPGGTRDDGVFAVGLFSINSKNAASELFKLNSEVYVNQIAESLRVAQNALAQRANKELSKPAVNFSDSRLARPQSERDKLQRTKENFVDQATLLTTVVSNLEKINNQLTAVKTKLAELSAASTPAERAEAALALDEAVKAINSYANNAAGYGQNPIGKPRNAAFKTADLYIASGTGNSVTVQGKFVGSDFLVTDSNGKTWHLDRAGDRLVQYDTYPEPESGVSYARADVSVASYDSATGSVTLDTPGGQVTGTLQKFGVGLLDSEFYGGLASDADVALAVADVDAAIARLAIDKSVFGGASATVQGWLSQINGKIKDLDNRISDVTKEMIDEKTAADKALKTRIQIQQNMLALTVGSSSAMVDLFFRGTIKTGSILDKLNKD